MSVATGHEDGDLIPQLEARVMEQGYWLGINLALFHSVSGDGRLVPLWERNEIIQKNLLEIAKTWCMVDPETIDASEGFPSK
jgi:hypothetical protein